MMKTNLRMAVLWPGLLLWAACTAPVASAARPENPAVAALVESASRDLGAGRTEAAAATLERAQRIEPGNPVIVHYLGQVRLRQGNYQQAEALAIKSDVLSGGDRTLRERNVWLSNAARQAAEQNLAPAEAEEDERLARQRQLDEEIAAQQMAEQRLAQEQAEARAWEESKSRRDEDDFAASARRQDMQKAAYDTGYQRGIEHIPRGHRPPPGLCRIWFPGRPPGKQPPAGDCRKLERRLPAGAWLIGS